LNQRARRISEMIHHEIASILSREMRDPRLKNVTVTAVKLTDDLGYAKIYYSAHGTETELKEVKSALQHALGFFRTKVGERLDLKYVPQLKFYYDETIAHADRMEEIFKAIKTGG